MYCGFFFFAMFPVIFVFQWVLNVSRFWVHFLEKKKNTQISISFCHGFALSVYEVIGLPAIYSDMICGRESHWSFMVSVQCWESHGFTCNMACQRDKQRWEISLWMSILEVVCALQFQPSPSFQYCLNIQLPLQMAIFNCCLQSPSLIFCLSMTGIWLITLSSMFAGSMDYSR